MTKASDGDTPTTETNVAEDASIETVIEDGAVADAESTNEQQAVPSHGLRNFILLLLLIIAAVIGALALSGKLMPLYQSLSAKVHGQLGMHQQAEPSAAVHHAPARIDEAHAVHAEVTTSTQPVNMPLKVADAVQTPAVESPTNTVASDAVVHQAVADTAISDVPVSVPSEVESGVVDHVVVAASPAASSSKAQEAVAEGLPQMSRPQENTPQESLASAQEVQALLSTIQQLHQELQHMEAAQQHLQHGLMQQQQMDLQVRLRWISDPASRLAQMQLAWEEISLLPGLSAGQRSQAEQMHQLARHRVQQLKQWQHALTGWANSLAAPNFRNVLPEPEYPWLAWIVSQFQLHQAPPIGMRKLESLRARLMGAARQIALESWPDEAAWQSLRAELVLQVSSMQAASKRMNHVDIGLPESFAAIQADIHTLRKTAQQWAHSGGAE